MDQKTHTIELVNLEDQKLFYWTGEDFSTEKDKAWSSDSYEAVVNRPEANRVAAKKFAKYKIYTHDNKEDKILNPKEVK